MSNLVFTVLAAFVGALIGVGLLISALRVHRAGARLSLVSQEDTVLSLLAEHGELYGLGLVRRSEGRLARGAVYVLLDRMGGAGLVESRPENETPDYIGVPRRIYRLTDKGKQVAAQRHGALP